MATIPEESGVGAQHNPLIIEDDDDPRDIAARTRRIRQQAQTGRQLAERAALQLKNRRRGSDGERGSVTWDETIEDILEPDIAEIIDLTDGNEGRHAARLSRAPTPPEEGRELHSHTLSSGLVVWVGSTIELREPLGPYEIQFLRVESIYRPSPDCEVAIRGHGFTRARKLDGMLPCRLNEVAQVVEIRTPNTARWPEHALVAVSESNVLSCRELRISNSPFPENRFGRACFLKNGKEWIEQHAALVCRFRYQVHYHGGNKKPYEWALVQIDENEADPDYKIPDEQNLTRWRGGKVPGGAYKNNRLTQPTIDLEESADSSYELSPGQRYTAGDVFAGTGGASRGIERAGLKLVFAVDHWEHAVQSLQSNFGGSDIYHMDVTDFITAKETKCDVDVLHLSPPCQFWSPAHTVAGKNDENNIAVLFSCTHLIEKFRPRLFTVEQTFGILSPKFSEFFNTLINGFTKFGYSVRWTVTPLANYGLPQLRKRLIMIGSAPGEKLPPFPPPTHSKDGAADGLKPWATPQSVLAALSSPNFPPHTLHQPHDSRRFDRPKDPWDPTKLARTITTNGGQNYHWNGQRDFTLLEYAVLQGFPTWHKFRGRYIKKQIGNAFAPSVVRVLYEHLVRWLLARDGFDPALRRGSRAAGVPEGRAILLEDGDDADEGDDDDDGMAVVVVDDTDDEMGDGRMWDGDGQEEVEERVEDEIICLGTPPPLQSLSEAVRLLNHAAKEEVGDEEMDFSMIDDLSDTETLRNGESGGDHREVDGERTGVEGSPENPFVISE